MMYNPSLDSIVIVTDQYVLSVTEVYISGDDENEEM